MRLWREWQSGTATSGYRYNAGRNGGHGSCLPVVHGVFECGEERHLLNESNLLYATLIFYAGAGTLYLGFGITGTPAYIRFASLATWAGLLANTGAVAHRWYEAGHPPVASIYEMLLSFVWMLAVLTLIAEKKYGVKVIGTVTMPVAIVGVVLMQLLRTEVHPLVPALQSTWLHVHVTLAMLAYAACALSFALAMMFLIQDKDENRNNSGGDKLVYGLHLSRHPDPL
jgi:ABC-type transport system involved in cytochrome c biogenesis permease subunit